MCTLYIPDQWAGLHTPTTPQAEKYKKTLSHSEYLWFLYMYRKAEATVNLLPLGCERGWGEVGCVGVGGGGCEDNCHPKKYPRASKFLPAVESQLSQVRNRGKRPLLQRIFVYMHWERKLYAKIFLFLYYCMMKLFMRQLSNSSFTIIIYGSSVFQNISKDARNFSQSVSNISLYSEAYFRAKFSQTI